MLILKNTDTDIIEQKAQHLLIDISKPVLCEGTMFHITASAGIVVYPEHGTTYEELLKNARYRNVQG